MFELDSWLGGGRGLAAPVRALGFPVPMHLSMMGPSAPAPLWWEGSRSCSVILGSLPQPDSLPLAFTHLFTYLFNRSS